jgi:hypothetical protein
VTDGSQRSGESEISPSLYRGGDINGLQKYKRSVKNRSTEDHKEIVKRIGDFLTEVDSDNLQNRYVQEIRDFLNELYKESVKKQWSCKQRIRDLYGIAAEMVEILEKEKYRTRVFFSSAKELGEALSLLPKLKW